MLTCRAVYILTGPLRAINSSCSPNVKFILDCNNTLALVVLEKETIKKADAVLANYGAEFFGEDWVCDCDEHWLPAAAAASLERDRKRQGKTESHRPNRNASSACKNADVCQRRRDLKRKRTDEHRNDHYHPTV